MSRRRGAPVAPRRVQGGLPGSPRSGLEQTKDGHPSSPAGTAAAECPEGVEPPAGEAPAAQISQRAPSPQGRGRLTARGRKALAFVMGLSKGGVEAKPPLDITADCLRKASYVLHASGLGLGHHESRCTDSWP